MIERKIENLIEEAILKAYGESHFNGKEVDWIRQQVIKERPDIIIHELDYEDRDFYKKHLPGVEVVALEPKNVVGRKYPKDLKQQFKIRENEMIDVLKKYINSPKKIIIVVGDSHLRNNNKEIGPNILTQFLKKNNVKIIRSRDKEIE
jgi:erythromycin esterase-like protein